jgi:hypothetical protein
MWGKRNPCTLLVGMRASITTLKTIWKLLKKLNIDLPYDAAFTLQGVYLNECDSVYSRGTLTPMFIVALFTIAKLWKQPICPTTDKWIKKMWYLYIMKFYVAMKKNEVLSFCRSKRLSCCLKRNSCY